MKVPHLSHLAPLLVAAVDALGTWPNPGRADTPVLVALDMIPTGNSCPGQVAGHKANSWPYAGGMWDLYSHVTPTMQRQAADAMDAIWGASLARVAVKVAVRRGQILTGAA